MVTKEEAEKLGFNFSKGPMKFENKKKKEKPNDEYDSKKDEVDDHFEY